MATFFGIEERDAQDFIARHTVCLPHAADGSPELQYTVSPMHKEDIVFIKHCDSPFSLHIKAVGIVQSDYPAERMPDVCLPVDWVWQGEKVVEQFDESIPLCGEALYEEHNIVIQREIIDLLADRYRMPQAW
ncbi:MAG: hypothetical protein KJ795_03950 [Gammaproteobacteria bacterium]|nr:hypothetical protein [Gammaproteobacteria bacterium]MBU1775504.1 hypothetical protein [Gammaproteobacteria bacterium]MBU1968881.1 hypothetical protein [Gammaproteobacteria bacterium]